MALVPEVGKDPEATGEKCFKKKKLSMSNVAEICTEMKIQILADF